MLPLLILSPLLILFVINIPFKFHRGKIAFILAAGLLVLQSVSALLDPVFKWSSYPDPLGPFFNFKLSLDSLSLLLIFTIGLVAFISLLVSRSTITGEQHRFNFINLLLIALIGMNATVMIRDIFSLYVFVEVTAVATLVLIALEKNIFAIEGTFKYLVLSMIASVFMLSAIAIFILVAGNTDFSSIHEAFLNISNKVFLNIATGLFLCGLLIKSGVVPFHGWVPDAYSDAHTAVSILLAGIVTKVSGVYILLRLVSSVIILSPSVQNVLMLTGAVSIVFAALAALTQGDYKRMLSYSSISQVGYIILAIGCASPLAFLGAIFHFFNHAIFKSLLFVNAASLERKFGSTDTAIISGLGPGLPVTNITSLLGMFSTAGIPPLSGFWSKLIIIIALFESGRFVYAAVALLASILTLAYFLSFQQKVFFTNKIEEFDDAKYKNHFGILFSEIFLAGITIFTGLGFPFIFNIWLRPLAQGLFK